MVSTIRMLAAAVMALALSGVARAEEAQFDFVLRGIKAGSLAWAGEGEAGGNYVVRAQLKSGGLAALIRTVRYDATARGVITDKGTYVATTYTEDADTGKRQSKSSMSWVKGVPTVRSYQPAREPRPYDVDPATQAGTVDPLTAMFATLRDVAPGQECGVNLKMFDGRRATAIVLGAPKADGANVVCAGEYRRIGGFPPDDMAERTRFPFTLTYAPAGDRMQVVEVAMDTLYGKARLVRR